MPPERLGGFLMVRFDGEMTRSFTLVDITITRITICAKIRDVKGEEDKHV